MTIPDIRRIAVIGAGSWGTALAKLLGDQGREVYLWGRSAQQITLIQQQRENRKYLPGALLPATVHPVVSLSKAVSGSQCVVMVVPSHGFRGVFEELLPHLPENCLIISAVKGIENNTLLTMTRVMRDILHQKGAVGRHYLGVISGPSFAAEVARELPTAVTVAFEDSSEAAAMVQQLFSTSFFRVYTGTDIIGLEFSAAIKNVVAIAAGISDGLGFGLNARAALITRGLAEITRLGVAFGAHPLTFSGLGGLGDLVLTCTGDLSRNRMVGLKLGQGLTLEQAMAEMTMVAEGVLTTRSCYALAGKQGVEMPILEQTYQILYEGKECRLAVQELFQRSLKQEIPLV